MNYLALKRVDSSVKNPMNSRKMQPTDNRKYKKTKTFKKKSTCNVFN